MTSNETIALVIQSLSSMMAAQGFAIDVQAAYQPTSQGTQLAPFITVNYVSSRRYGHPQKTERYVQETGVIEHVETYWLEETYQITAYAISTPTDVSAPTAYSYATVSAAILQSDACRKALLNKGVGLQRITDIRTPFFNDDLDRFEIYPSFDLVLTRQESLIYTVPVVASVDVEIDRV